MPIEGLSNRRRLPRAGTIRLGIKKIHETSKKEYPCEVDYFVCPHLVQLKYGPEPKELVVMFPVEDEMIFFPQFYNYYGKGILLCRGDGIEGTFWNFEKGDFDKRECPCENLENNKCRPVGRLQFLLPEIKEAVGVWQINTSSKNSIIDINSSIDFVRGIVGRVAMIPLVLKREPIETHRIEGNNIKTGKHYTMKISLGMSLVDIQRLGQIHPTRVLLPPPDETVPEDLFPPNGHATDEEKAEIKEAEIEETKESNESLATEEQKEELSDVLRMYRDLEGILTEKEEERLDAAATVEDYTKAVDYFKKKINKLQPSLGFKEE